MDHFISQVRHKLKGPLPGQDAQYRMSSNALRKRIPFPSKAPPSIACVLLLLYPKNEQWHSVYIQRVSNNPQDRHGGQISFPGGRYEEQDGSLENAAIREAEEEVGVQSNDVEILGRLTELFIPVSNFMVHPFVGFLDYAPQFMPQPEEVAGIVEVPVPHLLRPETLRQTNIHISNNLVLNDVPYFDLFGQVLWGATAMMTNEFLELISNEETEPAE